MYSTRITSLIVLACWLVWSIYWIANIKNSKKVVEHHSGAGKYAFLLGLNFIFLLVTSRGWPIVGASLFNYSPDVADVAAAVAVVGVAITLWSRWILADNWSPDVAIKKNHKLVTNGPYALVRHPIYTGLLGLSVGTAMIQGTWVAFLGLACGLVSCWIKLNQEEQMMLGHFGQAYKNYQSHTKRLIPLVF